MLKIDDMSRLPWKSGECHSRTSCVQERLWSPVLGEQLTLERKHSNSHDRHAVSVMKDATIVDHVPRELSSVCKFLPFFVVLLHHLKLLLPAIALPCLNQRGIPREVLLHHFDLTHE